ncbi:MAG: SPOR domain-containing protein [Ignavibacteriales bacterium]|nr:MAG: SPOR domain-containing protein [Ignavibacteriales bacterium]
MSKQKIIITILILCGISLYAQSPGQKWESVFESKDQIVYVDTSSIKQFENQISVLSITSYKQPQLIESLNKEAKSVKSQILFNAASKKYTVIGTLYYDKDLKILGETSLPGFASGSENFSISLEGNETMTAVFNKSVEYLKSGVAVIEQKDFSKNSDKNKERSIPDSQKNKLSGKQLNKTTKDSVKAKDRVALFLSKKDSVQKSTQINIKPYVEKTKSGNNLKAPVTVKKNETVSKQKNESETNPISTIFTDGTKYSFQVSSWKNKSKAESEVARLKSEGHNAFITEGYIKGATWYRVRIGYFNSLQETEEYMKKIK